MTLVIALNCKDGIVMASDGQATVGSSGGPVRVETEKIFKVNESTLFGASGSVGNIQKALEIIRSIKDLEGDWNSTIMLNVKQQLFWIYQADLKRHVDFYKTLNPNSIPPPPIADIILTKIQEDGKKIIWHIGPDCSDELLQELGYACTGSGDIFAHTLLKVFDIKNIDIERGKLLAYHTIRLSIDIGAYGLGDPIFIWTMKKEENNLKIEKLSNEEIMALKDSWVSWMEVQREIFDKIKVKPYEEKT
jgi:20S proteasome alpha/beta subunit